MQNAPPLWRTGLLAGLGGLLLAASVAWPVSVPGLAALSQGSSLWWLQVLALGLLCRSLQKDRLSRSGYF